MNRSKVSEFVVQRKNLDACVKIDSKDYDAALSNLRLALLSERGRDKDDWIVMAYIVLTDFYK